jgi:1,4-dihydroxy-2-naphthoate octaprenyltransferase
MAQTIESALPQQTIPQMVRNWRTILATANLPRGAQMDVVSKWLIITRAAVFSMTITSALIGGLLAAGASEVDVNWWYFALAVVGLVLAHAANNMINDYFDLESGLDDPSYPRALYAPHPVLSGLLSRRGLLIAILAVNAADAAIMVYLMAVRGPLVPAFALTGLFVSVFYVAKPFELKRHGLGEAAVLLVWGPLMIVGTFFVATGEIPAWTWAASAPYALVVMSVLVGKHLDKLDADRNKGVRTLPALIGFERSVRLNQALMIAFYPAVLALVATGVVGAGVAVTLLALPRLWQVLRIYNEPKPEEAPPGYPIWPLWYVSAAFYFNRRAGELFVLGLAINLVVGALVD